MTVLANLNTFTTNLLFYWLSLWFFFLLLAYLHTYACTSPGALVVRRIWGLLDRYPPHFQK